MYHLWVVPVSFYGFLKSIRRAALSTLLLSVYDDVVVGDDDYDDDACIQKAVIGPTLLYSSILLPDFIVLFNVS